MRAAATVVAAAAALAAIGGAGVPDATAQAKCGDGAVRGRRRRSDRHGVIYALGKEISSGKPDMYRVATYDPKKDRWVIVNEIEERRP